MGEVISRNMSSQLAMTVTLVGKLVGPLRQRIIIKSFTKQVKGTK
jgi:hypothetical protein